MEHLIAKWTCSTSSESPALPLEGQRLNKQSHLRKLQTCISELNSSGFNDWLLHSSQPDAE